MELYIFITVARNEIGDLNFSLYFLYYIIKAIFSCSIIEFYRFKFSISRKTYFVLYNKKKMDDFAQPVA